MTRLLSILAVLATPMVVANDPDISKSESAAEYPSVSFSEHMRTLQGMEEFVSPFGVDRLSQMPVFAARPDLDPNMAVEPDPNVEYYIVVAEPDPGVNCFISAAPVQP